MRESNLGHQDVEMPSSPPNARSTLVGLLDGRSESEAIAFYLAGSLRPNPFDPGIQSGIYFTDCESAKLSECIRFHVVPILESAGIRVVFCSLGNAGALEAAALVHDTIAAVMDPNAPQAHEATRTSNGERKGTSSIHDEYRARVGAMIVAAVERLGGDLVFIIEGVERLLEVEGGRSLLAGLHDARELVRSDGASTGHFLLVGIGRDEVVLDRLGLGSIRQTRPRGKA